MDADKFRATKLRRELWKIRVWINRVDNETVHGAEIIAKLDIKNSYKLIW